MVFKSVRYRDVHAAARIVTANALVSGIALSFVGGFDETFTKAAGEDLDLGLRLRRLGVIAWAERAVVTHRFPENRDDFVRRFQRYGAGNRRLEVKHNLPSLRGSKPSDVPVEFRELVDLQFESMHAGYDEAVDTRVQGRIVIPDDTDAQPPKGWSG